MIDISSTPILVIIILGIVGLIIPVIDALRKEKGGKKNNSLYSIIATGALILTISIVILRVITGEVLPSIAYTQDAIVDDMFGSFFAVALLIVSIMVTASSWNYLRGITNPASYYSLILLSSIGMVLIAYSTDFVMLFIAWELMSIPTYALAAYAKKDPISNEAALKYFMFGALSSSILVFAIGLTYGITGSTNIGESIKALSTVNQDLLPLTFVIIAMFIAGFGFKMGIVPFHMWLPDTYDGAPTTIGAFLAAGTKKAGFAAAIRIVIIAMFTLNLDWSVALSILAIITMTVGNLGAIMQKSVPRMLAYSSIAQAGYILIGLAVTPFSDIALSGSLFHIMNHAVMKSAAFIAVASVAMVVAGYSLEKYKGLGKRMPITAICLTISLLALAGVPPLNGFWSKLVIFESAIESGNEMSFGPYLAIAGVLNSALSLAYYAWIIRKMYMEEPSASDDIMNTNEGNISSSTTTRQLKKIKEPKVITAVLIFAVIFMIGFGIAHAPILEFASQSVPHFDTISSNMLRG